MDKRLEDGNAGERSHRLMHQLKDVIEMLQRAAVETEERRERILLAKLAQFTRTPVGTTRGIR